MYRWNKKELYFKYLYSIILDNPEYKYLINSLLKQYDLSHPKAYLEKYNIDEDKYSHLSQSNYYYDDYHIIPEDVITKLKSLYLTWDDIAYFAQQKFTLPHQQFTNHELMMMLDDIMHSLDNPDILYIYKYLIKRKNNTYNIQDAHKNCRGELSISGMTIYDMIFGKNYINILREYNIEDLTTLTHETMHAILNILLIEECLDYNDSKLFLEIEGSLGTALSWKYLEEKGYVKDVNRSKLAKMDSTLFLSSALTIGDIIFSHNERDLEAIKEEIKKAFPEDRFIDIKDNFKSYISFPAVDIIIDIVDYLTILELMKRPIKEATDAVIDIRLHNHNDIKKTLEKHNITFLDDNYATLKKEFTQIK